MSIGHCQRRRAFRHHRDDGPLKLEHPIAKNQNTFAKRQREQEKKQRADKKRTSRDKKKDGTDDSAPPRELPFPVVELNDD